MGTSPDRLVEILTRSAAGRPPEQVRRKPWFIDSPRPPAAVGGRDSGRQRATNRSDNPRTYSNGRTTSRWRWRGYFWHSRGAWWCGRLHRPGEGAGAPYKYAYSVLVYLSCLPGVFAGVLTAYALFFTKENLLDVSLLVNILPMFR